MGIRTTSALVIGVLGNDYDSLNPNGLIDVTPYITAGSSIADDISVNDSAALMTTAKLTVVETWLAAWAYCMMDPTYQSKSTGKASGSFLGSGEMSFMANRYGQTAMMLDSSGYLRALQKGGLVSGLWLGSDYATQSSDFESIDTEYGGLGDDE